MRRYSASAVSVVLSGLAVLVIGMLASAQRLPSEPSRQFGSGATGAFEGWFENPDGTKTFLLGYLNRNSDQELDVPIGPNNRIEPGGPDLGQPTHFLPGRQWGMFAVAVPSTFTNADQRLTWTITANGQTTTIPLRLHPDYSVSPFTDVAVKNTPPLVRFSESGPGVRGPLANPASAQVRSATVSAPLSLTLWLEDDGRFASGTMAVPLKPPPPLVVVWSKYRGAGEAIFEQPTPPLETIAGGGVNVPFRGKASVTVKFSEPGDYILHATVNDFSGEGGSGEVCCWTTAMVKVSVSR